MQELKAPSKRISGRYVRQLEKLVWTLGVSTAILATMLCAVCCSALYFIV